MAPALITYTLPTLQLVCNLVTTGNPSTGGTIPELLATFQNFPSTSQSSTDDGISQTTTFEPPHSTPANALPPGYVPHPSIGVAYKVYGEEVNWYVANARCGQDGGQLGNIDSFTKIELVKQQQLAKNNNLHVGFHLFDGDDSTWYSVKTGLSVTNMPWQSGEPSGGGHCARMVTSYIGLGKYSCADSRMFVCEIPYS